MATSISNQTEPADTPQGGVWSPSFQGLLWTNWLTAINDNVFRWFVIGVGKTFVSPAYHGNILMFGTVCFVLPYILFASPAGWLADRYKKRSVIVACKITEIVVMALGIVALMMGSLWLLMGTVLLMGAQSAFFAPSKIGTIPELLSERDISKGNGIFNLATLSAVVLGMGLGSWLADVAGDRGQSNIWLTALTLIGIATIGTVVSLVIKPVAAANPKAVFPKNFLLETWRSIVDVFGRKALFRVVLGVTFFWSIASLAQLNIDAFADESGSIFESEKIPLLVSLVLGVGVGSVIAGFASGSRIELGLVPWGAVGMATFLILLAFAPADFINGNVGSWRQIVACALLAGLGISAGFFDVPLASYLQHKSPLESRGAILSAANCLMFMGVAALSVVLMLMRVPTYETATSGMESGRESVVAVINDQSKIDSAVENLRQEWKSSDSMTHAPDQPYRVDLASVVPFTAEENDYFPALNELIYADAKERIARGQTVTAGEYASLYEGNPAEQRSLKKILQRASDLPLFSSRQIFLLMGLVTIPVIFYSAWRLSKQMMRLLWVAMLKLLYRVKITGLENLPNDEAAVLVANHTSWLDGVIFLTFIPPVMRVIAWAGNFGGWVMKKWADFCGIILISGGPKAIRKSFKDSRDALDNGEKLGLFPEGGISRSGQVRSFKPGLKKILGDRKVPIIPIYFDELWGSIFSYKGGKALTKFPTSFRRPISITIGKPIDPQPESMFEIQQSVQRLSAKAVSNHIGPFRAPVAQFVTSSKKQKFKIKIADTLGGQEKGGTLLTRSLVLRRLLNRLTFKSEGQREQNVGVLIPPTVGGGVVNLALALDKRVAINLNYSLSNELINHCIKEAGIKHVLTTKKVMEKFDFELEGCEVVYLDDFKEEVTGADKAICAFQAFAVPGWLLCKMLGLHSIKPDDLMTVVFTSGSTGVPKGVMLSHQNILSNVIGFEKAAGFTPADTIVGVLPFFHSFGYTITLWAPMVCNLRGVYHINPLDAKQIGKLVEKYDGTILMATPTFLRTYMRRCSVEQFKSLDAVVTGAERLPTELADQFEEKFGLRPVEGYGITELSPAVSANIPASRSTGDFQVDAKVGTVGRPIANVAVKILDLETDEELGPNQSGMLWVTGPIVMQGYLNKPEATSEVIVDGWFKTGDVAMVDEDGFITITGRMSRFSKIGGEMVPHLKVEEVLTRVLDVTPDDDSDDHLLVAVTAVPHEKKGERLVVLYTTDVKSPEEMRTSLSEAGLPNIFIPSADSFHRVDSLPLLGTGKLDLRGIKDMAAKIYNLEQE
jgi:acyl-[acyl-carrier-protein]-phospholipid O-acyltransferase/long-chain-fatty-acid--[acyl-carrier-protein] ligase